MFQDPYTSLDPRQSAEAAIDEVLRLHHQWPAPRRRARTAELTGLVGLDTRRDRAPSTNRPDDDSDPGQTENEPKRDSAGQEQTQPPTETS